MEPRGPLSCRPQGRKQHAAENPSTVSIFKSSEDSVGSPEPSPARRNFFFCHIIFVVVVIIDVELIYSAMLVSGVK